MLDREKVIEAFTRCGTPGSCSDRCAYFAEGFNCYRAMKHDLLELLKEQQDIVRCKDCIHYMTIHCTCDGCCISDTWFCADGEVKQE